MSLQPSPVFMTFPNIVNHFFQSPSFHMGGLRGKISSVTFDSGGANATEVFAALLKDDTTGGTNPDSASTVIRLAKETAAAGTFDIAINFFVVVEGTISSAVTLVVDVLEFKIQSLIDTPEKVTPQTITINPGDEGKLISVSATISVISDENTSEFVVKVKRTDTETTADVKIVDYKTML